MEGTSVLTSGGRRKDVSTVGTWSDSQPTCVLLVACLWPFCLLVSHRHTCLVLDCKLLEGRLEQLASAQQYARNDDMPKCRRSQKSSVTAREEALVTAGHCSGRRCKELSCGVRCASTEGSGVRNTVMLVSRGWGPDWENLSRRGWQTASGDFR